jgi:hypothetical protein
MDWFALTVFKEGSLNLSCGKTMAGNVDNVINTATDPVISVMVAASAVTGKLGSQGQLVTHQWRWNGVFLVESYVVTLVDIEVGVQVTLMGPPDSTGDARPGLLYGQNTLHIISSDLLARHRVDDSRFDTEEGQGGTAWLRWGNAA